MNKIKDFLEYYTTKQQIPLSFKAASSEASFKLKKIGNPDSITIKMSTDDGTTWTDLNVDTTVTLPVGTVCLLSGANTSFSKDKSNYYQFEIVDDIQVYGDLMSLCNYSRELNEDYQFYALFSGCTGIKGTPDLTAYKLTTRCYESMFNRCTGLVNALDLKAGLLADRCYKEMFEGCTGLTTPPSLPANELAVGCYQYMFSGCTSLTSTPLLQIVELADSCYNGMFNSCTSLTTPPQLPATTATIKCYSDMFAGCTGLTATPQLPATTLMSTCYWHMFIGCTSLTDAPILPATTIAPSCYLGMFQNCTNLSSAPQILPANTLAQQCYQNMFYGCSNLSSAPQLPAITLAPSCYFNMFNRCTSLITAPTLPATTLVNNCYQNMFVNCNQLTELTVGFSDWTDTSTTSATYNWVNGIINSDGWFNGPVELEEIKDESHIPINWRVNKVIPGINEPLTFTNVGTVSTQICLNPQGDPSVLSAIDLHYSINDGQWQTYTLNKYIDLQPGDSVAMSGNNNHFSLSTNLWYRFQLGTTGGMAGMIAASGNIMSLMNYRDTCPDCCFYQLFIGNNYLISADIEMPATTAGTASYYYMFCSCVNMEVGPSQITANRLGDNCCYDMFYNCMKLTNVPLMKVAETAPQCCYEMFGSCTSLTAAPRNMLPATTTTNNCYYMMFFNCTSLTSAPNLPASYVGNYSYYMMFYGCSNLVLPPESIGAHVGEHSCQLMFLNCRSLTTPPELKANSLATCCYQNMFNGCTSLSTIPTISASVVAPACYGGMFAGCSSIKQIPSSKLPLTTLPSSCYYTLFNRCSNLSSITVPFSSWNDEQGSTASWVDGVASAGIFTAPASLPLIMDKSHIPVGWRVFDTNGNERFPVYEPMTFKAVSGTSYIALKKVGTPYTLNGIRYSLNDGAWQDYTIGTTITLNQNDTIALSGNNTLYKGFSKDMSNYYQFAMTGLVDCSGNFNSLFYYDSSMNVTTGGVNRLFAACTGLLTGPKLSSYLWTIGPSACMYMFQDCWSMSSIPTFRIGNYGSYSCNRMFENCSSLLSANPIGFGGCSMGINNTFSYMYNNCYAMTGTVSITGTTVYNANNNFIYTFNKCSGITDAYVYNFTSAITEQRVFENCKALSSITTDSTVWPTNGYYNWVNGVAANGIFYKKSSLSAIYSNNYIPWSWNVINIDEERQPLTFKAVRGSTDIMMETVGEVSTAIPVLKYNKENTEWLDFIPDETVVHLEQGETAAFSGAATNNFTNNNETGNSRYRHFVTTGYYELDGNLQSLFEYSQNLRDDEPGPLFTRNSGMVKAPDVLPAKKIGRRSYTYMFYQCTSLTAAPYIACKENVGNASYAYMFAGCTSLTHMNSGILNMRLTFLAGDCMFQNCTSLTSAPDLNISYNGNHSHLPYMFAGCTALSTPPKFLNCIERYIDCNNMFQGCTSLTATPPGLEDIYANDHGAFKNMFSGCTNLVKGPDYLITKIANMSAMFKGCSKLTKAPELRNITNESLTWTNGMKEMFAGCSSLSSITVWFTDWNNEVATQNWVSGVAQSGNFECPQLLPVKLGNSNIPKKWRINGQETDNNYGDSLTFIAKVKNSTITLNRNGSPTNAVIYYNRNYEGWTPYEFGTTITVENIGEAVAFSGSTTTFSQSDANYYQFTSNGTSRFELTGNVMSLVNFADTVNYQWQFYKLFADCSAVLNTPQLPSKVLQSHCYRSMFDKCYNLTAACQFPIYTTNIKESSLRSMFFGCSSLLTVPEEIDCTTKTVETEGCKYMFDGCTAMSGSISLPASSLNAACYYQMFSGCNALTGIEVGFEDWNSKAYTSDWVNGITNNVGVFTKPSGLTTLKGNDYIPTGWLVEDGRIKEPLTFTAKSASNISLDKVGDDTSHLTATIKYNKNGDGWTEYTAGDVISLAENDIVMFSGNNNNFSYDENEYYQFKMTGTIEASGNIQSLINFNENVTNYCYRSLFDGCSGLLTVPTLSATTLAYGCYRAIFANCTSLSTVPVDLLPATTLANSCYMSMFEGCTSLTDAPALPATTLANWCYANMFQDCTALLTAPQLSATTLTRSCYQGMFAYCTGLTDAPQLPATTLAYWCYADMFRNCTSLTNPPQLPATTLADQCYVSMFSGCTSLTDAPALPATTLAYRCYSHMFNNCSKLSSINVSFTAWAYEATYYWVLNVAPTGIFTKPNALSTEFDGSRIPTNWTVQIVYHPLTFTAKSASNVLLSSVGEPNAIALDYKLNDGQWTAYTLDTQIDLASGDTLAFSGANDHFSKDETNYYNFVMTGLIQADGNVQALMNYSDDTSYYCYKSLFNNCSSLVTPPQLQATTLRQGCYKGIFAGCTSLSTAPSLPATTLSTECYKYMFKQCTSLKTAPILPATRISGWGDYHGMFSGCTSLTAVPDLPASALNDHAYTEMFAGCTSLTSIPQDLLPANNMIQYCYELMFYNCTGLSSIPSGLLHATTLAQKCYKSMFASCTNLSSIPQNLLPATTAYSECYMGMFQGCTSLSTAPALPATTLATYCYENMFSGCTSLTSAPSLPVTTLADRCYASMFNGCSSLTTAPQLPATTLANSCYREMFRGCSRLSSISVGFIDWTDTTTTYATNNWVNGVAANGTFIKPSALSTEYGDSRIPTNWIVKSTNPLTFRGLNATNAVCLSSIGSPVAIDLSYSKNDQEWNAYTIGDVIELSANQTVMFKGNNNYFSSDPDNYYNFAMTGSIQSYGNIQSLMDYSDNAPAYCYRSLFNSCSSLTKAPQLPATTLADSCYRAIFTHCTALTSAPSLPATTLADSCYAWMFQDCSSLSTAPQLSATTLAPSCYYCMFQGCSSLLSAPALTAATTLAPSCYYCMFNGCTSLTSAPELPATTLADSCYKGMFQGCTNLSSAPQLPATTLASNCYYSMFGSCRKLTDAPVMSAININFYGTLQQMFQGCRSLTSITVNFTSWIEGWTMYAWVSDVAPTGIFYKPYALSTIYGTNRIPEGWTVINTDVDYTPLTFTAKSASNGICLSSIGSPDAIDISYKKNDGEWAAYTINDVIELSTNQTVMFSGANNSFSKNLTNYYRFQMTGTIEAAGNIQSLMNYSNSVTSSCYYYVFQNCTSLTTPPSLPATTLANSCYANMFASCTSLSTAPQLPATTLANACYASMFASCFNLSTAPQLPATTLTSNCYHSMFQGCVSLSSAPQLPATTLYRQCYISMFQGCVSLSSAPQLPATTLANDCYREMFRSCTNLTSVPTNLLPASTLASDCYHGMFSYCTSLTDAPYLPATTLCGSCYSQMFYNCTNLSSISVAFTDWTQATNATTNWVNGVAANGEFTKPNALAEEYGVSRIPVGWTIAGQQPEEDLSIIPLTIIARQTGGLAFNKVGSPNAATVSYSKNDGAWTAYTWNDVIPMASGDMVSFSGANTNFGKGKNDYYKFVTTGTIDAKGNPMSLINWRSSCTNYCFQSLFDGSSGIIDASKVYLSATALAASCYRAMFSKCPNLTAAPQILATTAQPSCCWYMFEKCTSLTSVPEIMITTLADGCFGYMFDYSTNLASVNVNFTTWDNNYTGNWMRGVQTTAGTFYKPNGLTQYHGISRIPTNWTPVNK